jgi:hypothetical protein
MALLTPTLQLSDGTGGFNNFDFLGFEQPTSVIFGKEQSSYKHILIGGGRVIDMLGAGDPDITWSGYFVGALAVPRAQFLEQLAKSGKQLTLTTNQFSKNVVITRFTYGFHEVFPITYNISLQVVQDNTAPVTFLVPGDLTTSILEALIAAQDIAQLVANPSVGSAIALALIASQAAAPFSTATSAEVNTALVAAQNAATVVGAAMTSITSVIFPSITLSAQNTTGLLPDLALQSFDLTQLDLLDQISGILNTFVINNILQLNSASQYKTKMYYNPNLYRVAVEFYTDANLWTVIATANGLVDPQIESGFITLSIPPKPTLASTGVLQPNPNA